MTVDNINANTVTTNILKVNNDVNLKNLSVDDLSVVNTITTAIEHISNYLYLKNAKSYVKLIFTNNYELEIDENISITRNKLLYQLNSTFIYYPKGTLYFCKASKYNGTVYQPRDTYKFTTEIFGFYNKNEQLAILSTVFTQCFFCKNEYNDCYFFLGFKLGNNSYFAIDYSLGNNTVDIYGQNINNPSIAGNTECSKLSESLNNNAIGTKERYYHSLFPSNFTIRINSTNYISYVLRGRDSAVLTSKDTHLCFKFTDVKCKYYPNKSLPS